MQISHVSKKPIYIASLSALSVAIIGALLTKVGPWYATLQKPSYNPPNWLFGPAWTIIYVLAVFAAVNAWRATRTSAQRAWLISLFFINGVLNILWSGLFFTAHRPDWALVEVATLWLSVLTLVVFLGRLSKPAGTAMLVYLFWVTFAAYLNFDIVRLNGPFG